MYLPKLLNVIRLNTLLTEVQCHEVIWSGENLIIFNIIIIIIVGLMFRATFLIALGIMYADKTAKQDLGLLTLLLLPTTNTAVCCLLC